MDSSEAQALRKEDNTASTSNTSAQGEDGPKPKKAKTEKKVKKVKKKGRVFRAAKLGYTVHQGEDMLFVISSSSSQFNGLPWSPPKKKIKKKKRTKGKVKTVQIKKKKKVRAKPKPADNPVASFQEKEETNLFVPQKTADHRWGESLPEEVLINIFQMVVGQDGAVPFLCR